MFDVHQFEMGIMQSIIDALRRPIIAAVTTGAALAVTAGSAEAYYAQGVQCYNKASGYVCNNGGGYHSWRTINTHSDGDNRPGFCSKAKSEAGTVKDGSSCISPANTWAGNYKTYITNGTPISYAYGYWGGSVSGGIDMHVNADTNVT